MNSVDLNREGGGGAESVQSKILIDRYSKPDEWNTVSVLEGWAVLREKKKMYIRKREGEMKAQRDETWRDLTGGTALVHKEHWIWASVCLHRVCGLLWRFPHTYTHIQTQNSSHVKLTNLRDTTEVFATEHLWLIHTLMPRAKVISPTVSFSN